MNYIFHSEHLAAGQRHLNEVELASMLNMSQRTLQGWRLKGKGPAFVKFGASVRYATETVEAWIAGQNRSSTSATTSGAPCNILQTSNLSVRMRGAQS